MYLPYIMKEATILFSSVSVWLQTHAVSGNLKRLPLKCEAYRVFTLNVMSPTKPNKARPTFLQHFEESLFISYSSYYILYIYIFTVWILGQWTPGAIIYFYFDYVVVVLWVCERYYV